MDEEPVLTEVVGSVLVVTLNRPARRNAIDLAAAAALEQVWDRLDGEAALRAAVLTGAGGTFSAGADLKAAAAGAPSARTARRGYFGTVGQPPEKPLIAAVEGDALGGGFELALACDLIVAASGSRFGLPEARRGVLAAGGGVVALPARLAFNVAMEMAVTGAPQPAARLFALGLVNQLCAPGEALAGALAMAALIAENAPLAVAAAKLVLRAGRAPEAGAKAVQDAMLVSLRASADYREGIAAFAEKRQPIWKGQ